MQGEELFVIVIMLAGTIWLLTPVVRALAERIRMGGVRTGVSEERQRVRDELSDAIVALQREVGDLTERVEFAERLLAKQREPDRLPRGG